MKTIVNQQTIKQWLRFVACSFMGLSIIACADSEAQDKDSGNDNISTHTIQFSGETFSPVTRTTITDHVQNGGARVEWLATDKIWVKDNTNTWQESNAADFPESNNKSHASFILNGTYSNATHDVIYTNMPISGTQPQVEIKAQQTQSAPDNFDHAGVSGDIGVAHATKEAVNQYLFTLDHKASYLCLLPRSSNAYVNRSKLTKIEIIAQDNIAGIYNIASNGNLTLASNGSKTITLTTTNFALDNATTDIHKNGVYVVIAPGLHTMRIRYWMKNDVDHVDVNPNITTPLVETTTPVEGAVTKIVTLDCRPGQIHDVTANLTVKDYSTQRYYAWDAKQNYWWKHEWNSADPWQPAVPRWNSTHAYKNTDPEWSQVGPRTNPSSTPAAATNSCAVCPNLNEAIWYVQEGDPHYDRELWTSMGHLYAGGLWLKKKTRILLDQGITATQMESSATIKDYLGNPVTKDWRTVRYDCGARAVPTQGLPPLNEMADYFYLPAYGAYAGNITGGIGEAGFYWTSNTTGDLYDGWGLTADAFWFSPTRVSCGHGWSRNTPRTDAMVVQSFE